MKRHFQEIVDLIDTNIRQRGIGNPNPIKLGRYIKELERIYGIKEGRPENYRKFRKLISLILQK